MMHLFVRALLALAVALAVAQASRAQTLDDPTLQLETVTSALSFPTTMAFLGPDDFLVLEKAGRVRRVVDGVLSPTPVLTVTVDAGGERGLLGIAIDTSVPRRVFLYYTEAEFVNGPVLGNRIYRYVWNEASGTLVNPTLVLNLPASAGGLHNGGVLALGPRDEAPGVGDGSALYAVIGDQVLPSLGQLQNVPSGAPPDDTSVILRIRQDGAPAPGNPFNPYCSISDYISCTSTAGCPTGETCRTQVGRYYAYGIRNSFGLAFDPATGQLWDTENGPTNYDEINRVSKGMNSGWARIMGPSSNNPGAIAELFRMPNVAPTYDDPELSFGEVIAPTAIVFPYHSALGKKYERVAIIGDVNTHRLYALPLNLNRTGFDFSGFTGLGDLVADNFSEREPLRIGVGFPTSDLKMGPDGALYVVSVYNGAVYRIHGPYDVPALPLWAVAAMAGVVGTLGLLLARRRAV